MTTKTRPYICSKSKFMLGQRRSYPIIFLVMTVLLVATIYVIAPQEASHSLYVSAIGGVMGFLYFLYNQHLQETRLFTDLFREFNERFNRLNADLNRIYSLNMQSLVEHPDQQILYDYFNLCAEEYLYYKNGFIDPEVWDAWTKGMSYFAKAKHIEGLWREDLKNDSYYGFSLDLLALAKDE